MKKIHNRIKFLLASATVFSMALSMPGIAVYAEAEAVEEETSESSSEEFQPVTILDQDEVSMTITGIDEENMWGYALNASMENKTEDVSYMFSVSSAAINGISVDPYWASEVAAGKTAIESISFTDTVMDELGEVTDILLYVEVYDTETYETLTTSSVHIYPQGEENAVVYVREDLETDQVILDNDTVRVLLTDTSIDDIWGYTARLFIENKTDQYILIGIEDVSINDVMADPFWAHSLQANLSGYTSIYWSLTDLEDAGITEVENIEGTLYAFDYDNFDDLFSESIRIEPGAE